MVGFAATGRAPFDGDLPAVTAARILTGVPNLNGMTDPLLKLVELALAVNPEDRPTARDLLDMLLSTGSRSRPARTSTVGPAVEHALGGRRQGPRMLDGKPARRRGHAVAVGSTPAAPPRHAPRREPGPRTSNVPPAPVAVPPQFRSAPIAGPRPEPRGERRAVRPAGRVPAHARRDPSGGTFGTRIATAALLIAGVAGAGMALRIVNRAQARTADTLSAPSGTAGLPVRASVVSVLNDKCLDARDDDGVLTVHMLACSGVAGQVWGWGEGGTLRSAGRCLAVADDSTADGAPVRLAACDGSPGQQWSFTPGRDLVNVPADKCLDIRDRDTDDRARVQLWTCTGSANQKWNVTAR